MPRRYPGQAFTLLATDVKVRGIPHLAKNERDVGHPSVRGGERFQTNLAVEMHTTVRG
jgi:hypothetical protein